MADLTSFVGVAVSTGYVQQLITAKDTGVPGSDESPNTTIVYSANNKPSCFEIGEVQCKITDGSNDIDIASHDGTNGLKLGGTLVTSTAAEINYLDITAVGKTQASKAVVTDSNGDIQVPDSDKFNFGAGNDMALYHDGSNSYIANQTGALKLATETSGIAVTIGHTTSETTVADNLNTTGLVRVNDTTDATSATDGSLQTDGGLSVVKDCVFGDDVFLLSDAAVLNMGAGNDVTLTHDGITGLRIDATPISMTSTGDLTLDSTTDVVIDAAGGNVEFKDAGTLQLTLDMDTTSGVQILKLGVDTDDLVFQQYDGSEVCRMADDRRLYFYDKGGEYISSDGTDLTIAAGTAVNITADVIDLSDATKDVTLNSAVDAINFDSNTLSIDASNNRVGVGIAAPEAKLHILTGDASIAPSSDADEFVIEGSGHTGMSILGGASHSMTIAFGDSGDADIGQISYDHGSNAMNFVTATDQAMTIDSSGNIGIGLTPTSNMVGLSIEDGCITLKERATPTADADYGKVYTKTDNKLYFQDGAGTEHELAFV